MVLYFFQIFILFIFFYCFKKQFSNKKLFKSSILKNAVFSYCPKSKLHQIVIDIERTDKKFDDNKNMKNDNNSYSIDYNSCNNTTFSTCIKLIISKKFTGDIRLVNSCK
jgi:hypothetical protein